MLTVIPHSARRIKLEGDKDTLDAALPPSVAFSTYQLSQSILCEVRAAKRSNSSLHLRTLDLQHIGRTGCKSFLECGVSMKLLAKTDEKSNVQARNVATTTNA